MNPISSVLRGLLLFGASSGATPLVSLSIGLGANVHMGRSKWSSDSDEPLNRAVFNRRVRTVRLLLSKGADANADWMPLHWPFVGLKLGEKPNANKRLAELLIDYGADVNAADDEGNTALLWVTWAMGSHSKKSRRMALDLFPLVLERSSDVAVRNDEGCTALHYAAGSGDADSVSILLAHGADINSKNDAGETPLHFAAAGGNVDTVALLLDREAVASSRAKDGRTPIDYADDSLMSHTDEIVELLRSHGAKSGRGERRRKAERVPSQDGITSPEGDGESRLGEITPSSRWEPPATFRARIIRCYVTPGVGLCDNYGMEVLEGPRAKFEVSPHTGSRITDWLSDLRGELNYCSDNAERVHEYIKQHIIVELKSANDGNAYYHCSDLGKSLYVKRILRDGKPIQGQDSRKTPYGRA
jgi:ankyrin repeat protein